MADIWFTADLHFNHQAILKHCNRPFSDINVNNAALLYMINQTVKRQDTVYCLGDFIWKRKDIKMYFNNLPGKWILIPGNHDEKFRNELKKYVKITERLHHIKIDGKYIVLCHYPLESWYKSTHGSLHLHGHSHGTMRKKGNRFDVGVDPNNYKLVNYEDILTWLKEI